jgi:prepilin-type N-terminal cleavage/methylation domain-containing protein
MKRRLADEAGMSLVELLMVLVILSVLLAGLANIFVSGLRTGSDSTARFAGQQNVRTAVARLEFEVRCASGATVGASGGSVQLTLPSQCSHATGSYTWCISSGSLIRYTGTACSGTSQTFASNVTTATPFTLVTATGYLPRLQINLGVNTSGGKSTAVSIADVITLRNGARS